MDEDEICAEYDDGATVAELADEWGASKREIWNILRWNGVEMREPHRWPSGYGHVSYTNPEKWRRMVANNRASNRAISNRGGRPSPHGWAFDAFGEGILPVGKRILQLNEQKLSVRKIAIAIRWGANHKSCVARFIKRFGGEYLYGLPNHPKP